MFAIKTISNPEFKNCCLIPSECGKAYFIKQNKHVTNNLNELTPKKNNQKFMNDSAFEDEIAYTNRVYGDYDD